MNFAGLNERKGQGGKTVNKEVHKKMLPLDLQLFAEKEEQDPKEDVHTEGEEEKQEQQEDEKPQTLDDLLSSNKASRPFPSPPFLATQLSPFYFLFFLIISFAKSRYAFVPFEPLS